MELFEAIKKRHSYRGSFINEKVPKEDLQKIVEAGLNAPSAKNVETTQFVIIDDDKIVDLISKMHNANKAIKEAKAYIACVVDKNPESILYSFSFQLEDCSAAVENMLLAITALGYAAVWIDGWLRLENRAEKIAELIKLPVSKKIQILLPLGIPAEEVKGPKKKPFEERACFNTYEL